MGGLGIVDNNLDAGGLGGFDVDRLGETNNNTDIEHNSSDINGAINKSDTELDVGGLDGANNNVDMEYNASELGKANNNTDADSDVDRSNKNIDM